MASQLPESLMPRALALSKKQYPDQPPGFPIAEDFDSSAIRLPREIEQKVREEADDISEEGITDLIVETGFESVIVVDNLPIIGPEKIDKLTAMIKKIFSSVGLVREGGFSMPFDESRNLTKGFCFIEFEDPEKAKAAKEQGHNYRLDKSHTFSVCMFDDLDHHEKVQDDYIPIDQPPYQPREDLYSYMLDKRALDQFVIRYKDETEVYWWDGKKAQPVQVFKRSRMTESFVQWSPYGTYLATAHRQGIAIWGGPNLNRIQKFAHHGVRMMQFSPTEKYLVTHSLIMDAEGMPIVLLKVFNVRTGELIRSFQGPPGDFVVSKSSNEAPKHDELVWPLLKWAGGTDDKYFAKLGTSKNQQAMISVYETPDMVLVDKKSLKLESVQAFEWSPSDPVLCIYQRESGNLPARISLMKIPERLELRQKNLFNVQDVVIYWHPQGDYLAIRVNRHTKTKKSTYYGFELFRIREKDIPMEVMELPNKAEKIIAFAWEPNGIRFVVVHGEGPRFSVSFYSMKKEKGKSGVNQIGSLENRTVSAIHWSPKGSTVILAGPTPSCLLEFFNVDLFETMGTGDHYMSTELNWDPSGRYVATAVTTLSETDNGYFLWSFQGRLLHKEPIDRFFLFRWRHRRPSLLTNEKKREIEKNLEVYSKKYDAEDEVLLMAADTEITESRNRQMNAWKSWLNDNETIAADFDDYLLDVYGSEAYAESEFDLKSVELREIVEVKEEIVKEKTFAF